MAVLMGRSKLDHQSFIARFIKARDGNIAMLFGLTMPVLLLFCGAAIDYSRYISVRSEMKEALDAAALAMAQYEDSGAAELSNLSDSARDQALKDFGRAVFNENFSQTSGLSGMSVDFTLTQTHIRPQATAELKTMIIHRGSARLFGTEGKGLNIATNVEITRRGAGRIELALVLDVTGSMSSTAGGEVKINSLRTAVDTLLTVMFGADTTSDAIKIGIVPFNATVNPGGASGWSNSWVDTNADAVYHGARFFHVDQSGDIDMNTKVNHFDLFNSVSGSSWMGCVEARPYPLDEMDTVPGVSTPTGVISAYNTAPAGSDSRTLTAFSRAPSLVLPTSTIGAAVNSRWVPYFMPDDPDCPSNTSNCDGSWSRWNSYNINGTSFSYNHYGYHFDDPYNSGYTKSDYYNRDFINDYQYIHYSQGNDYGRYLKIMYDWRNIMNTSDGSLNANDLAFKNFNRDYGVTNINKHEFMMRAGYVGWWNPSTNKYNGKYDQSASIDEYISDSDSYTRGPNKYCPAPILPLTNNKSTVANHMNLLHPAGNTNSANGMVWGWRVVSPDAPFTEAVAPTSSDYSQWRKAVVLMTDGQNWISDLNTHFGSSITAYGYAVEERMGVGVDEPNRGNSSFNSNDMRDHIDEKLLRICARMKDEGILVYTIIFGLNDSNLEQVFKSCATSPEAPYYFKAPTGAELESAFGDIAADLVQLHVSR